MMKLTVLAALAVLLPGASLCSPASGEQKTSTAITQGAAASANPATDSMRGIVASVDQSNDTIAIQLIPDKTEQFRA